MQSVKDKSCVTFITGTQFDEQRFSAVVALKKCQHAASPRTYAQKQME